MDKHIIVPNNQPELKCVSLSDRDRDGEHAVSWYEIGPIVAWSINKYSPVDGADPVTLDALADNEHRGVLRPDKTVIVAGESYYRDIQGFIEAWGGLAEGAAEIMEAEAEA